MSMKNWTKEQKREHEVMLKWNEFHKINPPTEEMEEALNSYFQNKNTVSEYKWRLKNINGYLTSSIERINELMEEYASNS